MRYWLRRLFTERIPMWIAYRLPPRVALWAFVRVSASAMLSPDETTYVVAHTAWTREHKL